MIFYFQPPSVQVNLRSFNDCSLSRLKYFLSVSNHELDEISDEALIPGTKMDQIGHFVLRCYCVYNPTVRDFIIQQEISLFLRRLKQLTQDLLHQSCRDVLKAVRSLKHYQTYNPLNNLKEKPFSIEILIFTLTYVCKILTEENVGNHFLKDCRPNCKSFGIKVPFQVCLSLIRERQVIVNGGYALIPCSGWSELLKELFHHHYEFGLTLISTNLVQRMIQSDPRWLAIFYKLSNSYNSLKCQKPATFKQELTFRHVDIEKQFFPPCMSNLLYILRTNHRLSYQWRFNFSLFLKDIGLSVTDSLEFWKNEYSKSCSAKSKCQHSWQANYKKYTYSIRHMYGLEGSKRQRKSRSCLALQSTALGMRDEGGCPFVHFDHKTMLSTLSSIVASNDELVSKISASKLRNQPTEACSFHMCSLIESPKQTEHMIKFNSPVEYYFNMKKCSNMLLQW